MALDLLQMLSIGAGVWIFILIILLFIWALKPSKKVRKEKREFKGDLKKIKEQINGE